MVTERDYRILYNQYRESLEAQGNINAEKIALGQLIGMIGNEKKNEGKIESISRRIVADYEFQKKWKAEKEVKGD